MEMNTSAISVYEGRDPFLFASYHSADTERVMPILEVLDRRGFRFWCSEGITPGMDADEIIAQHIESSDFFIAFLSRNYLTCLDTVDELNFSRDVDKSYLLVYLEDVVLPAGLDMRFLRAKSIPGYSLDVQSISAKLMEMEDAARFYGVADPTLRPAAEKLFQALEQLYPEHKVFALDAVARQRSKELSELYVKAGYASVERLLQDYGFEHISTGDARALRSSVLYQPGQEPDSVKPRVDFIMNTLSAAYPGKVITDNLSKSHHAIHTSLLGLSVWLGYESAADMLNAYGFTGVRSDIGRTAIDHDAILKVIRQRYEGKVKPDRVSRLLADNPDLRPGLKTMANKSMELFGMPLRQYLLENDLLDLREKQELPTKTALKREGLLERLRGCYPGAGNYGTFEDTLDSLGGIVLKENAKSQIYAANCTAASGTLRLPLGIEFIAPEAFSGQSDITELILPPTLREICAGAFMDCSGLESIVFSEGLERIGSNAFDGCSALKRISLPASVKHINTEAFAGCLELAEVELENPRINIREDAFDGCLFELDQLQREMASPAEYFELKVDRKNTAKILAYTGDEEVVVIPGTISGHPVISIEKGCFKDNTCVREIYMDDDITAINGDAFKDCVNLEKVHISNSVSKFTASAFAGCTSLREVNIPHSMTDVPRGLFKDSPLTAITIGKGVRSLCPDAFCKGTADIATGMWFQETPLETLVIDPDNPHFSAEGTTLLSKDGTLLIAELGSPVNAVIPAGVEEIGPGAFEKLGSLVQVELPSSLKRIGEKAFAGSALTAVEFPDSLESIGTQAFSFCRNLAAAEFYDGLKVISQQAFEGCPIQEVFIPASVEILGGDSFLALASTPIPKNQVFRIDSANEPLVCDGVALYRKTPDALVLVKAYHKDLRPAPGAPSPEPIAYAVLPGTVVIEANAFRLCTNLAAVTLPDGLRSIGDMAFFNCQKLTQIHIPESCTDLSPKAFFGLQINRI